MKEKVEAVCNIFDLKVKSERIARENMGVIIAYALCVKISQKLASFCVSWVSCESQMSHSK